MYQKLTLVGNLGNDPELRLLPDGKQVANFSLATNRRWNEGGEKKSETMWFRISVWGKQAEAVNQYLVKGRQVLVEGRLRGDPATGGPRIFTRQDGTVGTSYEVWADSVRFLSGKDENGSGPSTHKASVSKPPAQVEEDEEIPF